MTLRSVVILVTAVCLLTVALPDRLPAAAAVVPMPRMLPGHVPDVVARRLAVLLGHHNPHASLRLAIGLRLRHRAALRRFLRALDDPASADYHHFLTQQQANQRFDPTVAQERAVERWLQSSGLTVMHTYPNHLIVDVRGTVAQIERLLHLSIKNYRLTVRGKGRTFFAPATNPTVPASVSAIVQSITGLDSYPRIHLLGNGTAHGAPPYYPQDFANAYNVNPLWNAGYTGSGQHIAVTLWTLPPSDSTLQHFTTVTGAAVATQANGGLKVIPVDGGSKAPDDGEAAMDIEYTSGLAPGATVDYYEVPTDSSGNGTDQGLEDALERAGTDGNKNQQISNSWGGCEGSSTDDPFTHATSNVFQANAATGHTYLFASGDNGSWCDPDGSGTGQDPFPGYPTSSPYVLSVGGTRFNGPVGTSWPGETGWTYCADCSNGDPEGSGGGYSALFARPSWQQGNGLADNGMRGYPDIAAAADPQTGAYVCFGANATCNRIGGTSLATPLWAGMIALLNNYLAAQGGTVGFLAPLLYRLAGTSPPYAPFHDITTGVNGGYEATVHWDEVTGWGSPNLYNLARDLAAIAITASARPAQTGSVLLQAKGTGSRRTASFTAPASWTLQWNYNCANVGGANAFVVAVQKANGQPSANGRVVQRGTRGSGTNQYRQGGTFVLQITTRCTWQATAKT
jgi:kumamolisin